MINLLLPGCSKEENTLERIYGLRDSILTASSCSFTANISADYGNECYSFVMNCTTDAEGKLIFDVVEPAAIKGVSGQFGADCSDITFDGHVLAFPRLADGLVTPVSAPWIFIETLRSGYIYGYYVCEDYAQFLINNTYEDEALELSVYLNDGNFPTGAEIMWQGRRILTLEVSDFVLL